MGKSGTDGPVLVAVDFSDDSEAALLWACNYAACVKSSVLILHVVHDPADEPGFYREREQDWTLPMSEVAGRKMKEFAAAMRDKHESVGQCGDLKFRLVEGLPGNRIVEVADAENARQIVVGSLGRSGLDHAMLGSVAEMVVRSARQPVTVVKSSKEAVKP